jgi:hypothetical protein
MIRTIKVGIILGGMLISIVLAACGCQNQSGPTPTVRTEPNVAAQKTETPQTETPQSPPDESQAGVDLTLQFSPGSTATYRTVVEQGKSVGWQGAESTKPKGFEDGHTDNRIEITFDQSILKVDPVGDAVARITIVGLKYFSRVHNEVGVDFDSTRPADKDNPLARLIGQSYQIKLSRRGDMLGIVEAMQARFAVPANSAGYQIAQRMLSDDIIRERHTVAALAALKEDRVQPGQSWSSEKSFSFSWMGSRSFERVYTLKGVSEGDGEPRAVVEMKAIPAAGQQAQGLPAMGPFAGAFDNTSSYEGQCVFDLEKGRVRESTEQLHSEWVMMDPEALQNGSVPGAVKMTANWSRRLELVK